mmetsp:Transcript_82253/g.241489  ORF Transcript_82253/g.241489 Transcript_82253/m.241489 type:complete len:168 (-) Transcript_82253:91-594(-)
MGLGGCKRFDRRADALEGLLRSTTADCARLRARLAVAPPMGPASASGGLISASPSEKVRDGIGGSRLAAPTLRSSSKAHPGTGAWCTERDKSLWLQERLVLRKSGACKAGIPAGQLGGSGNLPARGLARSFPRDSQAAKRAAKHMRPPTEGGVACLLPSGANCAAEG